MLHTKKNAMKIRLSKLRQIIKEEVSRTLREASPRRPSKPVDYVMQSVHDSFDTEWMDEEDLEGWSGEWSKYVEMLGLASLDDLYVSVSKKAARDFIATGPSFTGALGKKVTPGTLNGLPAVSVREEDYDDLIHIYQARPSIRTMN